MGLFDSISSFLNPGAGYGKAQNELDKYYQQGQGYLQPYNQYGQSAYGDYSGAMKKLLDPAALEAEWSKGYSTSPSAINAQHMAQESGLDAASGLGLMGSNTALNAIQGGTANIGLEDRQNYMNNLMQKYMQGTGIAGNIYNTGAGAAGQLSNNAMNMGNNSAQMAYNKQNAGGNMLAGLIGMGGGIFGPSLAAGLSQKMGWSPAGSYNPSGGMR